MPATTVGKVCLPRIRSGTEIIAFHITEKCLKPWRRVNVLGVERGGLVPIRVHDPDEGITLISPTELDTSFPKDGAQTNHVKFIGLDYNIQRLWDYDGLWKKDSDCPKLRLDETWVILDPKGNIVTLGKEYPEIIRQGEKRGKVEVVDSHRLDYSKIMIPSLRKAAETLNLILELVKPVQNLSPIRLADSTVIDSEPHPATSATATVTSSLSVISILNQNKENTIAEDKITASIISNLLSGSDLTPPELEHLQSDKFEIKNHNNRLELIRAGKEDRVTHNFDAWKYLGMSKTILKGLSFDKLKELNDFAREKKESTNCFAHGLLENDELKRLLANPREVEPQLRTTA